MIDHPGAAGAAATRGGPAPGSARAIRAIRGATSADANEPGCIRDVTREMLAAIMDRNGLATEDLVSAVFTVTPDLTSEFPARAARELGWLEVPMLCTMEIPVPGALERCVRVLLHVETTRAREDVAHVYLRGARTLRPDWAGDE